MKNVTHKYVFIIGGSSMNIETSTITKKGQNFLVTDIEDMYIRVDANQVAEIFEKVDGVEQDEIVILLATIKKSRIIISASKGHMYKKASDEAATRAIIELLAYYPIDNLIGIFGEIKYYQIKKVLESDSPIRELDEYI